MKLSALHPRYEESQRERALRELTPSLAALARRGEGSGHRLHHRCRGGGSARPVARSRRGAGRRSRARRLGRARPRGAGLSEARAALARLAGRSGAAQPTPADGAPGQGRLLGQRDQAQPGARSRRLSRLYQQARDRRLLSRLRPAAPRRARRRSFRNSPPTTRTPSRRCACSPASDRDFEFQRLHGMGEALYDQIVGAATCPAAPMRRSAGTRICWPIWCAGCSRTAPIPLSSIASSMMPRQSRRSSPIRSRGSPALAAQAASAHSPAARPLRRGAAQCPRHRSHRLGSNLTS